jgi:hypothetical protein
MEIGRGSQVLLGGTWDFFVFGETKRRVHTEDTENGGKAIDWQSWSPRNLVVKCRP